MIIIDQIKEMISYDPDSGLFKWISASKYHNEKNGTVAGCERDGYIIIKILGSALRTHRLAWLYVNGHFPIGVIDHINGNGLDNRICNLRDVTITVNTQNHKERIKENGLPTGVSFCKSGYRARIQVNKKKIFLGVFENMTDAHNAYREARNTYHDSPVTEGIK